LLLNTGVGLEVEIGMSLDEKKILLEAFKASMQSHPGPTSSHDNDHQFEVFTVLCGYIFIIYFIHTGYHFKQKREQREHHKPFQRFSKSCGLLQFD